MARSTRRARNIASSKGGLMVPLCEGCKLLLGIDQIEVSKGKWHNTCNSRKCNTEIRARHA